jgi:cysteinyl-tRNA synthetase
MKLTGEQSESEVSHDRVEIATMKELEVMEVPTESVLPQLANVTVTDVPAKLFENWFELETYTIVSANYTVTGKDYFTTLYNKISSLLDYKYRYYHADMELLFDINSTVFDYGSVGFIWNPSRITTISNNLW